MKKTGFSPKTKKILTFIAIVLIAGMFVVRGMLMQSGTLDDILTKSPEEITTAVNKVQMTITSGSKTGMGTAIDSFKNSTKEETFSTYLITANHIVVDPADITATLGGETYEATLVATDADRDLAVLVIQTADEVEALYERDFISRLKTGDTVYYMSTSGDLVAGTLTGKGVTVQGLEITSQYGDAVADTQQLSDLFTVSGDLENGMSGGGVYDVTGYYVGMIIQGSDDGTLACIPGNEARDVVKAAD